MSDENQSSRQDDELDTIRFSEVDSSQLLTPLISRRFFMIASAATGVLLASPWRAGAKSSSPNAPEEFTPTTLNVKLKINGKDLELRELDPRTTLLDALRENLGFTGTKKGCDHGQCGACTVHVNGRRINSCLTLAAQNAGKEILTIEGLANGEHLHPMQNAFIEKDAFQCGFCTPGQIMSAIALESEKCGFGENEIRECMSGNLCRCGAQRNILSAIQKVHGGLKDAAV